jgi:hypothetical protein
MANTKVTGDLIASSTIATGNIADNAVTSDKISGITTAHITEGSNLYYTDARADARVALIVDSAPATLDTLNELAAALGDDPNFATTTANSIGLKAPLASPSFTGNATFAGNVGIGTGNTIYADLEVKRAGEVTLALHNSSAITSGNRGNLAFYNSSVSTVATIRAAADTDNVGTALEFYTRPVGGSLTNSMTIDSSGKSTFYSNEIEVYASSSSASLILNSGDATKDEWTIVTTDLAGDAYLRFVDTTTATTVMSLRDNGNLGIGTNSPDNKLDVRNGELTVRPSSSGNGGLGKIGHSSSNAILQLYDSSGNEDVRISTSLSSYFNGGNVGIGTTSPSAPVHIKSATEGMLWLDSSGSTASLQFRDNGTIRGLIGFSNGSSIFSGADDHDMVLRSESKMHFVSATSAHGISIDANGKVGIGTDSPSQKLEVNGNIAIRDTYKIFFNHNINTARYIGASSSNDLDIASNDDINYRSNFNRFWNGGTEFARLSGSTSSWIANDSNGKLGIGTTSPSSKLTVYGGGTTSSTLELRGAANGGDNATISTQQSMVFQIGSAGATGRSFTFSKNGLGYSDGTALFAIDANGGTFNRLWPQTGTSGSSSVVQTTLIPEPGIYEYFLQGNPNAAGSGSYRSLQAGLITIAVDYTSAKSVFLRIKRTVTAQDGGGSSNIQLNLNVYMLYNGSASDEQSIGNKDASVIYLTVSGYAGTVGSGQILRLTRKV